MPKILRLLSVLCVLVLLNGCENAASAADPSNTADIIAEDVFTERDFETDYDLKSAHIYLKGDTVEYSGVAIRVFKNDVYILDEGTYILSGTLNDGMIIVNADKKDKIQLVLNGVTLHSQTCSPIYVAKADKVFITTVNDTVNTLSNGGTFEPIDDSNIDSVIFSKEDLTLNGKGSMVIDSPGGHGIVCKDSLAITGGSYEITAAGHALEAKDDICIADGSFLLTAGKDGLHAEHDENSEAGFVYIQNGSYSILAEGDGISASAYMRIDNGTFQITAGGGSKNAAKEHSDNYGRFMGGGFPGESGGPRGSGKPGTSSVQKESSADSASMKGVKAVGTLTVNGGEFYLNTADDSIHSNTSVSVFGGTFDISCGDDAFHADDTLTIDEGRLSIAESYEGLEAKHITINGGDIVLNATDDGINAAGGTDASGFTGGRDGRFGQGMHGASDGSIVVNGGMINITAYGDGIDANGSFAMHGGTLIISGPVYGDTSTLDYDVRAVITGGTFIGTGSTFMAQSFSEATQGLIAVQTSARAAGSEILLTDINGEALIKHAPALDFAVVILSSPEITSGKDYTLSIGSVSGSITAQ